RWAPGSRRASVSRRIRRAVRGPCGEGSIPGHGATAGRVCLTFLGPARVSWKTFGDSSRARIAGYSHAFAATWGSASCPTASLPNELNDLARERLAAPAESAHRDR